MILLEDIILYYNFIDDVDLEISTDFEIVTVNWQ